MSRKSSIVAPRASMPACNAATGRLAPGCRLATLPASLRVTAVRRAQLKPHTRVGRIDPRSCSRRLEQHRAGHAQVLGEMDIVLEAPQEVLATSPETLDAPALERA